MKEADKTRISHYTWDLILIAFVIIIIVIKKVWFSNLDYRAGLAGNPFYELNLMFISLSLFVFLGIMSLIALIRLIKGIIDIFKTKRLDWLKLLLLIIPFVLISVFFINKNTLEPGAADFLRGYEKWVQKEVDVISIQKWLGSLNECYSNQRYFEADQFPEKLPEVIKKLEPYHMYFSEFKDGQRSVEFEWGCALAHWGIRIGLPGMETPDEGCIKITESLWEYRCPFQSGVYIFNRG